MAVTKGAHVAQAQRGDTPGILPPPQVERGERWFRVGGVFSTRSTGVTVLTIHRRSTIIGIAEHRPVRHYQKCDHQLSADPYDRQGG